MKVFEKVIQNKTELKASLSNDDIRKVDEVVRYTMDQGVNVGFIISGVTAIIIGAFEFFKSKNRKIKTW